jgi:hypothetical protein
MLRMIYCRLVQAVVDLHVELHDMKMIYSQSIANSYQLTQQLPAFADYTRQVHVYQENSFPVLRYL